MNYGKAIRIARSIAGMSQAILAAQSGIDRSYLSLIESEKRAPSMETLNQISRALKLPFHLLTLLATEKQDAQKIGHEQVQDLATELTHLLLGEPQDYDQLPLDYSDSRESKETGVLTGTKKRSAA